MTRNRLIYSAAGTAALALGTLAYAPSALATDFAYYNGAGNSHLNPTCSIDKLYRNSTDFAVDYNSSKVSVGVDATALSDCNGTMLSLVSYSAPDYNGDGESLKQQQLVEATTLNIDSAQGWKVLEAKLPQSGCYQVDFIVGEKYNDFKNGETYASERLIDHLNKCVGDVVGTQTQQPGGSVPSTPSQTAPTPSTTPTPAPVAGSGSGPLAINNTPAAHVAPAAPQAPATLPQTGSGLGATGVAGVGAGLSGLVTALRQRRTKA